MGKPVEVAAAPLKDGLVAGRKLQLVRDLAIGNRAFGDDGVFRQQSVVVETQMDLDGAPGAAILSPVEDLGAEAGDGAVQAAASTGDQQWGLDVDGTLTRKWLSRPRKRF